MLALLIADPENRFELPLTAASQSGAGLEYTVGWLLSKRITVWFAPPG